MPLMHEASNPNPYSPVRATKATTQPQGIIGHPHHQTAHSGAYSA